jgi:uncharacterized protein involved in exopolysaccharide biosynthesis
MSAREIVALLFREINLVLIALIAPIVIAVALFSVAPKSFEADAKILVNGRDTQVSASGAEGQSDAPQTTSQEVLNSEVEILTSRELADRTIASVGALTLFPHMPVNKTTRQPDADAVNGAFAKALAVKAVSASHVIEVSLQGPSPQVVTRALNRYLELYEQIHRETYSRPVAGFLASQLKGYEAGLRGVEAKIAAFSQTNKIFDPVQEQKDLLDTRNSLSATSLQLSTHAGELAARVAALRALRDKTPEQLQLFAETDESDAMQRARAQLLDLKQQQTKLAENYQPTSRTMRDVQDQITSVSGLLAAETKRFADHTRPSRNPLYDELTAEIARAEAQIGPERERAAAIQAQIGLADQRLAQIAQAVTLLDPLQRQRAQDVTAVTTFRQREVEAKLAENLDLQRIANVRIIQSAAPTSVNKPAKPKLRTYLVGGLVAGILLAVLTIGVLFARKNTFLVPESLEASTKIPVLVSLPAKG